MKVFFDTFHFTGLTRFFHLRLLRSPDMEYVIACLIGYSLKWEVVGWGIEMRISRPSVYYEHIKSASLRYKKRLGNYADQQWMSSMDTTVESLMKTGI